MPLSKGWKISAAKHMNFQASRIQKPVLDHVKHFIRSRRKLHSRHLGRTANGRFLGIFSSRAKEKGLLGGFCFKLHQVLKEKKSKKTNLPSDKLT